MKKVEHLSKEVHKGYNKSKEEKDQMRQKKRWSYIYYYDL